LKGIINEKSEEGIFIENDFYVSLKTKGQRGSGDNRLCLNAELAKKLGYIECMADGCFYLESELSETDKNGWLLKKNIPSTERSKNYNLASDPDRQKELEGFYKSLKIKPSVISKRISNWIGNFTFGMEVEVINGFLPRRIRSLYGIKALKDGSLRHDGGEGRLIKFK
jgi:hypothetical protein